MSDTKQSEAARALRALSDRRGRVDAALADIEREDADAQKAKPDPLSPEAFAGRTINGRPVRWLAWDRNGWCGEYSTERPPERDIDGALTNDPDKLRERPDLRDPARAGQTLYVGPPAAQEPADAAGACAECERLDGLTTELRAECERLRSWVTEALDEVDLVKRALARRNEERNKMAAECERLRGEAAESEAAIRRLQSELLRTDGRHRAQLDAVREAAK